MTGVQTCALPISRLASAQAPARRAGILLLARRLASRVALAGTSPPLGVTTRLTAEVATLVDMELAEARLASAQVSARREGILKRQLLRALGRPIGRAEVRERDDC